MDLFKWMGVGNNSNASPTAPNGSAAPGGNPINKADYKQFGLENFGNTCYANSVLQALYFCQPFRELVCDSYDSSNPPIPHIVTPPSVTTPAPPPSRPPGLKFRRRDSAFDTNKTNDDTSANGNANGKSTVPTVPAAPPIPTSPPTLFSALRSLFLHIALNPADKGKLSPTSFINKLKMENELYRSSMHQDAHEFLGFLLNKIVEDLEAEMKKSAENAPQDLSASLSSLPSITPPSNSSGSQRKLPPKTFVHSLFEGTLTSETRCLTCETVSSRDESFLDLSIDIEQNSSVTACLRQFSASEMLSRRNKFFCDTCGSLQEAEKRMKIKKLPNILALHLKRFKYQEDLQKYIKLSYRVAFPFELRLFNTVDDAPDPDRLFQLFAIVVHIGNGPNHGHYISIVRAHGTWYVFDDDTVDPIKESDIHKYFGESQNGSGYVLFYQAVDLEGIAPTTPGGTPVPEPASKANVDDYVNGVSHSVEDDRAPEVAIVVHDDGASTSTVASRPVPSKLTIPSVVEPGSSSGTPTAEASTAISNGTPNLSGMNGFSDTATVSSQSSGMLLGSLGPGVPVTAEAAPTSSSAPLQLSIPPTQAADAAATSPSSEGFLRKLRNAPSAKALRRKQESDTRRPASSAGEKEFVPNGDAAVPPLPPLPASPLPPPTSSEAQKASTFSPSKSVKGDKWFLTKRKSMKVEKERLPVPAALTQSVNSSIGTSSTISSVSATEGLLSVPSSGPEDPSSSSSTSEEHPPPSPETPTSPGGRKASKAKVPRPSTSPSAFPSGTDFGSRIDEPLPPLPPASPASGEHPSSQTSPLLVTSSTTFPSSASTPTHLTSQTLSPASPAPPLLSSSLDRSATTSAKPLKRASRKMSLSAMPGLAAMFGRKDKDKDKEAARSSVVPRRPSLVTGTSGTS